jgi:hypothetical protein
MQIETRAFTYEQRQRMALAVAAHMHGPEQVPDEPSDKKQQSQNNVWLHNYAIEKRWTLWQDMTVDWDLKVEDGMDLLLEIGCSYPNDDTLRVMIAIVSICSKRVMKPASFYNDLRLCRDKLVAKRKNAGSNVKVTAKIFPKSVKDFMEKYPYIYKEDAPPIPTLIDDRVIKDCTRPDRMPCRSNAKAMNEEQTGNVKRQKSAKGMAFASLQPVKEPENDPTLAALRYVLSGTPMPAAASSNEPAHAPFYGIPPSTSFIKAEAPALQQTFQLPPLPGAKQEAETPTIGGNSEDTIDKMINDANLVIATKHRKKPAAAAKAQGSKTISKAAEIDQLFADDDADEDGESEDETSDEHDEVKRKPAAKGCKKGGKKGGAVLKRPAAKDGTNKTIEEWENKDIQMRKKPVFKTLFDPKECKNRTRGAFTSRAFHALGKSKKLYRLSRLAYAIAAKIWDKQHKK